MSDDLMTREKVLEYCDMGGGVYPGSAHAQMERLARTALAAIDAQRELWDCLKVLIYTRATDGVLVCGDTRCHADRGTPHLPDCIITRLKPKETEK